MIRPSWLPEEDWLHLQAEVYAAAGAELARRSNELLAESLRLRTARHEDNQDTAEVRALAGPVPISIRRGVDYGR